MITFKWVTINTNVIILKTNYKKIKAIKNLFNNFNESLKILKQIYKHEELMISILS